MTMTRGYETALGLALLLGAGVVGNVSTQGMQVMMGGDERGRDGDHQRHQGGRS